MGRDKKSERERERERERDTYRTKTFKESKPRRDKNKPVSMQKSYKVRYNKTRTRKTRLKK